MSLIFKYGRISLLSLIRRSKLFSFAPKVIRNILESCLKLTVIPEVTPVISHLPSMIAAAFLVFLGTVSQKIGTEGVFIAAIKLGS
jgi:hypothetical protein